MAERCRACAHPERSKINDALMRRTDSTVKIAERFGLSPAGVKRHAARHLRFSAQAADDSANALTIISYANDLYRRACAVLDRAEAILRKEDSGARGVQAAAVSLREVRGSVELLAKLVVASDSGVDPAQVSRDTALDLKLEQALALMVLPALGGTSDVVDAVVID